jgi:hypothetical protein
LLCLQLGAPVPRRLAADYPNVLVAAPGASISTWSRARLGSAADTSLDEELELRPTFHAVPYRKKWKWILPPARYHMYLTDAC